MLVLRLWILLYCCYRRRFEMPCWCRCWPCWVKRCVRDRDRDSGGKRDHVLKGIVVITEMEYRGNHNCFKAEILRIIITSSFFGCLFVF